MVWLVYPKIQSVMGWQDSFLELIPIEIVVSLDAVVYLVMSQFLGVSRLGLCVRRRLFRLDKVRGRLVLLLVQRGVHGHKR